MTEATRGVQELLNNKEANEDTKEALHLLLKLDALTLIYKDIGTWLEAEYFDAH